MMRRLQQEIWAILQLGWTNVFSAIIQAFLIVPVRLAASLAKSTAAAPGEDAVPEPR